MAQTGYTPLKLYRSSTTTNVPLAANLNFGELAINYTDGKLFYKDNGGVVQVIGTKGGTGSSSNTQVLFNSSGLVAGASGLTWDGSFLTASSIKDSALTSGRITFAGASGLLSDASTLTWDGTYLTANSIKDSALTSGRITFAGAAGLLRDASTLTWDGTYLTANSIKNTALTSGRVTFAGASGLLSDSVNFTWDGTSLAASNYVSTGNITINTNKFTVAGATGNTLIAGTATVGTLTSTRLVFAGTAGLLSDSANLTWNGSTLAITGALTATTDSTFSSTGALTISKGTTGQQPGSPVTGMMRYNSTTNQFEGYSGALPAWKSIGGSALSNDTTTATDEYPVFASATTGTAENLYTSNAQYLFKPSTGELKVKAPVASNGIVVNADSMSSNYTIATGTNGFSVGPLTINSGVTLTVASGQRHVII